MKIEFILQKLWDHAIHLLGGIVLSVVILIYVRRCLKDRKKETNKGQQEEESHGRRGEGKKERSNKRTHSEIPKSKRKKKKSKRKALSSATDIDDARKYQALEEGGESKKKMAGNGRSRSRNR